MNLLILFAVLDQQNLCQGLTRAGWNADERSYMHARVAGAKGFGRHGLIF
jgi:hypothetical protein